MEALGEPEAALEVAALARLLSHPLRVRILAALAPEQSTATQLAPRVEASVSLVAYHLNLLAAGGAVELVRTERVRGTLQHIWRRAPGLDERLSRFRALLT